MRNLPHRESEKLAVVAEGAIREGLNGEARELYLKAAARELESLNAVGPDKVRTRGILAVSLVSLYYKAAAYQEAATTASRLLRETILPAFAREQLEELEQAAAEESATRPMSKPQGGAATFEVYRDKAGEHRWRLRASNGNIIADSGEGYTTKADCVDALELVKKLGPEAYVVN